MAIQTSKERNALASLRRNHMLAYFGEPTNNVVQPTAAIAGEYVSGLNNAQTGLVSLIGADASDVVQLPNGATIPTGKSLTITDANGLSAGGILIPTLILHRWTGDAAQAVNRSISIARIAQKLVGANIVFGTASSSGTVTLEKLTGTTAPGSGTVLFTGTLSTAGTANTVLAGTLSATPTDLVFAVGDRLGAVFSGTETGLVGLVIEYAFQKQ